MQGCPKQSSNRNNSISESYKYEKENRKRSWMILAVITMLLAFSMLH